MTENNKPDFDAYKEIAKHSLVRMQYSCSGNSTNIDETDYIPIVSDELITPENDSSSENNQGNS